MKKMISLTLSLLMLLSLCLCTGCGDSEQSSAEKALIGSWSGSTFVDNEDISEIDATFTSMAFDKDGTGTVSIAEDQYSFTWEFWKKDDSSFESELYHVTIDGEQTTLALFLNEEDQVYGSLLFPLGSGVGLYYEKD